MKLTCIVTYLLIPALTKPILSDQYKSLSSSSYIGEEVNLSNYLPMSTNIPLDNFFESTLPLQKSIKMMSPSVIETCIKFLVLKKKDEAITHKGKGKKFKNHENLLHWFKALDPSMIHEVIGILRNTQASVNNANSAKGRTYYLANTFQDLHYINDMLLS